jgi:hypothetical protein
VGPEGDSGLVAAEGYPFKELDAAASQDARLARNPQAYCEEWIALLSNVVAGHQTRAPAPALAL